VRSRVDAARYTERAGNHPRASPGSPTRRFIGRYFRRAMAIFAIPALKTQSHTMSLSPVAGSKSALSR